MIAKQMTNAQARVQFVRRLDTLKKNLLQKFDAGRRKHNTQEIWKLDFEKEMKSEVFDLIIYSILKDIIYGEIKYPTLDQFTHQSAFIASSHQRTSKKKPDRG